MRAAAACDRDSTASIDANRSDAEEKRGREGFMEGGTETYPFCSSTSLRLATCQTILLTLYSQNINKEPATQRARSKYNVPSDLPSLPLPRFTTFLVLHDPSSVFFLLTELHFSSLAPVPFTFSSFPSFIPLLRLFLFVPFLVFGQLLCIVREPSARS